MYLFGKKKKTNSKKHEPWNGRGKTVERPSNAVERPQKKKWNGLNKTRKGFPQQ